MLLALPKTVPWLIISSSPPVALLALPKMRGGMDMIIVSSLALPKTVPWLIISSSPPVALLALPKMRGGMDMITVS
ncbi:hypothetical protein LINGRAHAP2_LOCUS25675, partial [Linum grandiflorum]